MSKEWDAWSERHAAVFGLTTEPDARMLAEWCELFRSAGFAAAELDLATSWLALHGPPKFRSEHLAALHGRLQEQRLFAAAKEAEARREEGPAGCRLCDGSGRAIVPNLKARSLGRWGTAAVLCGCPLGRWYQSRQRGLQVPQQTLEDCETLNPDWADEMEQRRQFLNSRVRAEQHATALDRAMGEVLTRLRRKEASGG